MLSVSDILKILDQIPIWKTLSGMPKRLDALEAANAELAARLDRLLAAPKTAPGQTCKACGQPALRRTGREIDPAFGDPGVFIEHWTCGACGATDTRTAI